MNFWSDFLKQSLPFPSVLRGNTNANYANIDLVASGKASPHY